ncbi:outer membrane cobalamin receptor [Roseivirga ehrenbergii]|uniref:Cobalamin receptor protein n=2 Tax=Roseivirga ehrenbergii (strain DSM 102268 / JCM 13514 / KCTC 12282 / NCIMB 14502 / KMM 6017) TaxID=279360 RepID=A0A150XSL6_ROSEK|nr:cobalamin receptor protein [Roseivirga ehrenbergii]TCL10889.1 outer membrane cobalamin receptor [Roseivirga ehrenbergii]
MLSPSLYAQLPILEGMVYSNDGGVIPGAHVSLNDSLFTVSSAEGKYSFTQLQPGAYRLRASFIGFNEVQKSITIQKSQKLKIDLTLEELITELTEVTVTGKSEASELKESVAAVALLEAKLLYSQSNNTSDVIKQISGVNVRQTGGFGSDAEVYINGMSGKQVKFFLDGIPLSYFGSGMGLNVLPVNLMKQIEVYKGVVPVNLGADALGGAINIVPRKEYRNYLDVAYSYGSFNSHKLNLNGQLVQPDKGLLVGINSFYNHSDNNYTVDIEIPNEFGNPQPATVERFHDKYSNHLINLYAGVVDKNWTDRLILSLRLSGLDDDVQHNAVMSQPYGEAVYSEATTGFSVEYEKEEILPKTGLKWYGGMNFTKGEFTDTTLNAYTWDGEIYRRRTDGGEISTSRNLLELNSKNAVSRFNIVSDPWNNGKVIFNVFSSWFRRTGEDPIAAEFYGQDFYQNPTVLIKNATGLAYEHTFLNGISSYTALKHFAYQADGYAIQNLEFVPNKQRVSNIGYSQSFRANLLSNFIAKASYEYATRLPDEFELFGDFTLVRPNPFLKPEQSHNANLGLLYTQGKIKLDINGFYRHTDNIIWLRTSQFFAQYQNLLEASVKGFDVDLSFQAFPFLSAKANLTFQDIRNRSPKSVTGSIDDKYFNARLPNIPYLFGNAEVKFSEDNFLGTKSKFSAWWSGAYVNEFYLFWAVDGNRDLKNVIPNQFIQNAGISYIWPDNRLSITLESTNIFDTKAYDNFSVQRPGRAFYLTLRTFIN